VIRRLGNIALGLWLPITIFVAWWLWSADSTSPYYPPLSKIVDTFREDWIFAHVETDLVPSLIRIAEAFGISVLIGVGLGVAIGSSEALRSTVEPTLEFIRAVPAAAILPVAIIVFGISDRQKVFVIAFGAVWPILLNTIEGVRGIDPSFQEVGRAYSFRRRERLFNIMGPAALPQIMAGMRVALSISILLLIYAELFAATDGLGYYILNAQQLFEIPEMWAGIFVLSILAYVVNLGFAAIERRALYWHRGWRASQLGDGIESRKPGGYWRRVGAAYRGRAEVGA
jgi:ABC-type nitrate/sulfonate/bicarbonate transport system permease component